MSLTKTVVHILLHPLTVNDAPIKYVNVESRYYEINA